MKRNKAILKVMPLGKAAHPSIAPLVREMLRRTGEDPLREGLRKTPERFESAFQFLTSGYRTDLARIVNDALFEVKCDEMVVVKDIEFFSLCEHHLLPFYGKVHVAYLPKDKVIGLSKIPRIVDMFARRLQVQERMTQEIAEAIESVIGARGVGVICEAQHFCMMMRGVEKQHSSTISSAMLGGFRERKETRDEFLSLVRTNSLRML
jgi:GTP cyclohydrolase I